MAIPAIQSSLNGVMQGIKNVQKTATNIANPQLSNTDFTQNLVQLSQDKQQVESSIKALKISHDTIGTLLDITV